jgi:DNA invertase Pin-like site-specific DNA recombinase
MNSQSKIQSIHLERSAYVYIRQSTMKQVEENLESQDLQYQLVKRAQVLGWEAARVTVIDDDLGKSAVSATQREGFQNLVSAVGLGQVGVILVTDVSRLARNCSDWYRLLDLASLCNTLISDASGIYDPRIYDDRLLLGLKGTFSEAQWYNMRAQLGAARENKAKRGELRTRLPIGFERAQDGKMIKTSDLRVQAALQLVFDQFEKLGSGQKVLRYLRDEHLTLPRNKPDGVEWVRASYQIIYNLLKQPAYAGAYVYGKHHRVHLPGDQHKVVTHILPQKEWPVLLQNTHPAYITWEQYQANQRRLSENAQGKQWIRGAARNGLALLTGIVVCGRCGRAMHVHYTHSTAYICDHETREYAAPRCQNFTIAHIDQAVSRLILEALQPARLEAALTALQQMQNGRQELARQWQLRLEQARYQAELARRRYQRVDPDLRLVAAELERDWEQKLVELQKLEQDWQTFQEERLQPLSSADQAAIRQLSQDLPALWFSPTTSDEERKRILRCLIQQVTLDSFSKPGFSVLKVLWQSGTLTTFAVPRPGQGTPPATGVANRLRQLAAHLPDDQIANLLNAEGFPTATGLPWTLARVLAVRRKHHIPTACPYHSDDELPRGDGLVNAATAAKMLDVSLSMISDWFRDGLISGHQRAPGAALWVRLHDDDLQRLNGHAALRTEMIPLHAAEQSLNLNLDQIRAMMGSSALIPYRILQGRHAKWFLLPNPISYDQ